MLLDTQLELFSALASSLGVRGGVWPGLAVCPGRGLCLHTSGSVAGWWLTPLTNIPFNTIQHISLVTCHIACVHRSIPEGSVNMFTPAAAGGLPVLQSCGGQCLPVAQPCTEGWALESSRRQDWGPGTGTRVTFAPQHGPVCKVC